MKPYQRLLIISVFFSNTKDNPEKRKFQDNDIKALQEVPSRWQRSKTWRSPSSPQIHQNYIYMWDNFYRTPTEHWQKTSGFPKGKKLPVYLGRAKEKRKNRDKRIGKGPAPLRGSCEGGKVSTHQEAPSLAETGGGQWGEASEPWRRAQQHGCRGLSGEIPAQRISADQHSPASESCLLTRQGRSGLGAEAQALEVRSQGEDWGQLHEHGLKGTSAPQLAVRESGEKSGTA